MWISYINADAGFFKIIKFLETFGASITQCLQVSILTAQFWILHRILSYPRWKSPMALGDLWVLCMPFRNKYYSKIALIPNAFVGRAQT
jgi:hypothetical protein